MTMRTSQLLLSLEVSGLAVRVLINGIVVQQIDQAEQVRSAARLTAWTIAGSNRLEIQWKPQSAAGRGPRKLGMVVQRVEGEMDAEVVRFELPTTSAPMGNQAFVVPFEPAEAWSWQRAQTFATLPPFERSAIVAVLDQVKAAMEQGDAQFLVRAQTIQIGEQARAGGGSSVAALDSYRAFLAERLPMTVDPLTSTSLNMELMGDGRIVHVVGQAGHPAIFGRGSAGILAMSPYFAKVNGTWQIVR